ncbi:MAG: ubiquinone/menaquinone biosynthesis methyltransferase [Myxococcales bacterium]|nr:ubiquinone/menaquinone biosynthesis methyltransferase [Myxococcales bacterium]
MSENAEHPLREMFCRVAPTYDRLNRLLSLGIDRRWRRLLAREILTGSPRRVLDLCAGTGDLTIELARRAGPETEIMAADFCPDMLERARDKAVRRGLRDRIAFIEADAAELPFPDGRFGAIGIAFAFRNLVYQNPRWERHLSEIRRVCAPGGRLCLVETSQPRSRAFRFAVHAYLRLLAVPLGGAISKTPADYEYLGRSARGFLDSESAARMLEGAGFSEVKIRPLLGGAACIHTARRHAP